MNLLGTIAAIIGGAIMLVMTLLLLFTAWNARRAGRRVPVDGRFITVDGARLHYVEMGEGSPILLIHGLGGQLRNFTYALAERLAQHHRVIALDRPGAGYSVLLDPARRDVAGQAGIVAAFVRAKGLDRPLVVGHSLGGAVALAMALDTPGLVRGLALIAPLTQPIERLPAAFAALNIPSPFKRRLIGWTLATPLGKLNRAKTRALLFGPDPAPDDFEDRGGGALTLRPATFFAASTEVSLGTAQLAGMVARYPELQVPVGILYGMGDRILSPELQGVRTVQQVPGAEIRLIEGGHMLPITAPDICAEWILAQYQRTMTGDQTRAAG